VKLTRDSRPCLAQKARLQHDRHSGGYLLVYPERGMELDETAASILRQCDGTKTIASIAAALAAEFDGADLPTIEADTLEFLQALADRALLGPP
jgi:coenzyme PQQ biosynthesis protein PqqD